MKRREKPKENCPHLSWMGVNGMMCCRGCGKMRLPEPWENARQAAVPPGVCGPAAPAWATAQGGDVDALRIRYDGRDGDV